MISCENMLPQSQVDDWAYHVYSTFYHQGQNTLHVRDNLAKVQHIKKFQKRSSTENVMK